MVSDHVYCCACGYVLDGLSSRGSCPECGGSYDVDDPLRHSMRPPYDRRIWRPLFRWMPIGFIGAALVLLPFQHYWLVAPVKANLFVVGMMMGYRYTLLRANAFLFLIICGLLIVDALPLLFRWGSLFLADLFEVVRAIGPAPFLGIPLGVLIRKRVKRGSDPRRHWLP